jgi:PAS domain S-box-containing protein
MQRGINTTPELAGEAALAKEKARREEAEERLRLFIGHAPAAIALFDRDMRYIVASRRWLADYGLQADVTGKSHYEIFPEVPDRWREVHRRALAGEVLHADEDAFERTDGSVQWVRWEVRPWHNDTGEIGGIIIFAEEITDRKRSEQARLDALRLKQIITDNATTGIIMQDATGRCTFMNPAAEQMTGFTFQELKGRNVHEAIHHSHPDGRPFAMSECEIGKAVMAMRPICRHEDLFVRKDGTFFPVMCNASPVQQGGVLTEVVLEFRDVTEEKRAENALRESGERMRSVVNHVVDGITTIDEHGTVATFNPAAERIFGYESPEVVGRNVKTLMPDPYRSQHDEYIGNYLRTGQAKIIGIGREVVGRRKDGSTFPMELAISGFRLGERRYFTGIVRDITERKQMEESLRQSEARFRQLADMMPQLAWMARPDGHIYWYNKRWYEYTGTTSEQMEGWGWQSVHDSEELPKVLERWKAALARGEPWEDTFPLRRSDGKYHPFLSRAMPLKDERGHILHWFGTNTDVSQIKEKEDALREADRRKDEFLAMLGHELRNPLAAIRNGLHILLLSQSNESAVAQVKAMMDKQVGNLTRMVDDLLDVSRITRGKIELRKEPVVLATMLRYAIEAVRPLVEAQRHTLTFLPADPPIRVLADPTRLEQVFVNLLANAAKYTKHGGYITLTVERSNGEAVIRVRDNGVGIRPDLLPKMFDLFVQSDRSLDRAQGGLGIGLTLVKKLVDAHGGSIEAYSEGMDKGSEFIVRLPALATEQQDAGQAPEPDVTNDGKKRVLVVDDAEDVASTLRILLEMWGYSVRIVEDGPSALVAYRTYQPDIVLLDIGLPGMNGYDVARQLRRQQGSKRPFIMAVTGYGQDEDKRRSQEAGFDYHVTKPVDPDKLQSVISAVPSPRTA